MTNFVIPAYLSSLQDLLEIPSTWGISIFLIFFVFSWWSNGFGLEIGDKSLKRGKASKVAERMICYALLSSSSQEEVELSGSNEAAEIKADHKPLLDKEAHQILLGTLKKVEAKNGVMATVLVFLLAAAYAGATRLDQSIITHVSFAIFLTSTVPVYFALVGIKQVDQGDFEKLQVGRGRLRSMQNELMVDLMRKERALRISRAFILLATLLLVFAACVSALNGLSGLEKEVSHNQRAFDSSETLAAGPNVKGKYS